MSTLTKDMEAAIKSVKLDGDYVRDLDLFSKLVIVPENGLKCFYCKHRKDEPFLLPKGGFYPSPTWMVHFSDTHGYSLEVMSQWLYYFAYVNKKTGKSALKLPGIFGLDSAGDSE